MRSKKFVMVDIETLDTRPSSVVLTIGAVSMTSDGTVIDTYDTHLNVQEQLDTGRTVSASTLGWWLSQTSAARDETARSFLKEIPLVETLTGFKGFLERCEKQGARDVYANGPEFDTVILRSLFESAKLKWPVANWNIRSFREMKMRFDDPQLVPPFAGDKHNALHDAIYQAQWLNNIEDMLADHSI